MSTHPWWHEAVVYQIYPRSFMDSDGDGVGDLPGIQQRLDYLESLGIDAVWISPFYPSPMADFGYDVADYRDVDPLFGTLADFDRLLAALHARNIRVIVDFVPNHTSDRHAWFVESRSSRENPKRDWYVWRDPAPDGGPPNNWLSMAGGRAWTLDPPTGQYYLHSFLAAQPDLDWRNPEIVRGMHDVLRFWLERGVDGFRLDVLWFLAKDPGFHDDPVNPDFQPGDPPFKQLLPIHSSDGPGMLETATAIRDLIESYPGQRLFIGEVGLPLQRHMAYYGPVHMPFNFALIWAGWTREKWHAAAVGAVIAEYMGALPAGAWPNWVTGNHDQPRTASRIGPAQARIAMLLLLTLKGTPTLYQGEELGLESVDIPPDRVRDPFGLAMPGTGQGRDPVRTPLPWDATPGSGFTAGEPWLPLGDENAKLSVAAQDADAGSMLAFTRALLKLRREEPALRVGSFELLSTANGCLVYRREHEGRAFIVALNLDGEAREARLGDAVRGRGVMATGGREREEVKGVVRLAGDEGIVVEPYS